MRFHLRSAVPVLRIALAALLPFFAAPLPAGESSPCVTVTESASIPAAPDEAKLDLAVKERGSTVKEAREKTFAKLEAVRKALRDAGVPDDRVSTAPPAFTMPGASPMGMAFPGMTPPKPMPAATILLTVTIPDPDPPSLSKVWTVFDAAEAAGAEAITGTESDYMPSSMTKPVATVRLGLRNPEALEAQALSLAAAKAKAKAGAAAAGAGQKLGALRSLSASPSAEAFQEAFRNFTPDFAIQPGTPPGACGHVMVRAAVTATYALEP